MTWEEADADVQALSAGLLELDIRSGQPCVVVATACVEAALIELALWCVGAVVVPVSPGQSPAQIAVILEHTQSTVLVGSDAEHLQRAGRQAKSDVRCIVLNEADSKSEQTMSVEDIRSAGREVLEQQPERVSQAVSALVSDQIATQACTVNAAGALQSTVRSHDDWLKAAERMDRLGIFSPADLRMQWQSLAHPMERCWLLGSIRMGLPSVLHDSGPSVYEHLQETRSTFAVFPAATLEDFYAATQETQRRSGGLRYRLFCWALDVGAEVATLRHIGQTPTGMLLLWHGLARRFVLSRLRAQFGVRLRFLFSTQLHPQVTGFFHALGVDVLEGYWDAGRASLISVNRPGGARLGTLGTALTGVMVRSDGDGGELEVKMGPPDDASVAAPPPSEWQPTGRCGAVDEDGYVHVIGRRDDVLTTSSGPCSLSDLERHIRTACPYVSHAVVDVHPDHGAIALLALRESVLQGWLEDADMQHLSKGEVAEHPHIHALLKPHIDQCNDGQPPDHAVHAFAVIVKPPSVEGGTLTATGDVIRPVFWHQHAAARDALLDSLAPSTSPAAP